MSDFAANLNLPFIFSRICVRFGLEGIWSWQITQILQQFWFLLHRSAFLTSKFSESSSLQTAPPAYFAGAHNVENLPETRHIHFDSSVLPSSSASSHPIDSIPCPTICGSEDHLVPAIQWRMVKPNTWIFGRQLAHGTDIFWMFENCHTTKHH